MFSLLYSLVFDNSSTVCTIALTILIKLLPIFAVKASGHLKSLLPLLLVVLARILCWRARHSALLFPVIPEREDTDSEEAPASDTGEDAPSEGTRPLPIREDIDWERLELTFDGPASGAPSAHRYFTFLYYLFPCNTIRFLRYPVKYLNDSGLESVYAADWEAALDEQQIRSKSEVSSADIVARLSPSRLRIPLISATPTHARPAPPPHMARSEGGTRDARLLVKLRHPQDRRWRDHAGRMQRRPRSAPRRATAAIAH